ncbi:MAG: alcohol dehydrogenase catalytic domain-containing protein [Anaerolineae bacterium]
MKAAVLRAFGQPLTMEDRAAPEPAADEVIIQTKACGIDGTDLKLVDGFGYTPQLPFVMGHEIAGVVHQPGKDVTDFQVGERVIVYNFLICGKCPYCLTHREQLCVNMRGVMGVLVAHGGFGEYVKVPARQLVRLPDNVSWEDGAICCDAGLTALHGLERAHVGLGDTVLIIGVGGVGSVLTQLAQQAGAHVIAADANPQKASWAEENGAHHFLNSDDRLPQAVRDLTKGMGADCVLDVVGKEGTMSAGLNSLRRGGRMVIIGYTPDALPLPGKQLAQNELEVIGTRAGRRQDLANCVRLVAEGRIKPIVRYRYPIAQVNEALSLLRSGTALGRIVLQYST